MLKLALVLLIINNICVIENITLQTHENIVIYQNTSSDTNQNYYLTNYMNKKEESALKFLQFYNSFNPVVLLVENTQQNQNNAINFYKSVYRLNPRVENINFMLMKFNMSGVSTVLETTRDNKIQFEQILNERITKHPSNFLGRESFNKSAVFFAILNAAHILPPNSGIIIFMKKDIEDVSLAQHALVELLKKRIQIFVIWGGRNKDYLLNELTMKTRGAFLIASDGDNLSEVYYEEFLKNIGGFSSVSMILTRKNLEEDHNLLFPIDSYVTGIHISIAPNITRGILTTPRGYSIDVLGSENISRYSVGSFVKRDARVHEIHLNTTTATTQDVGVWSFRVGNARATLYNLTIFAHTELTTEAVIAVQNLTDNVVKTESRPKILKLGITGDISSITNVTFVDKNGKPVLTNVTCALGNKEWENYLTENIETNEKKELNVNIENIPHEPFYAVINGKDSRGHEFERLSYVKYNNVDREFYLPPITVQVGLGSELITQPYRQPQLFFEVINNGNTPSLVRFFSRDEKGILLSMTPWYKWINPQETAIVRVVLTTRSGVYQDVITFTAAAGSETVNKKVIVDVGTNIINDRTDPDLNYHFTSDCTDVLFGSCEDGSWTVEVKAKDTGSGLLQVSSSPRGIYFPTGFTTGTTEEVTAYYSESCCNPDLKLFAFDRQNNRRTRTLNAYRAALGPGAIAAIVLGVILFIIIVIVIVVLSRKYCVCWRKKDSYDLPVYRGPRSTSSRT